MSVQALSWVFDFSPTTGAERLVLMSLANHAGKDPVDGAWESWPGVKTIAREAGVSERTVTPVLGRLALAGAIERLINAAPDSRVRGDKRPNLYRILTSHGVRPHGTPSDDGREGELDGFLPPFPTPTGDGPTAARGTPAQQDGTPSGRGKTAHIRKEPSVEPSVEPTPLPPGSSMALVLVPQPPAVLAPPRPGMQVFETWIEVTNRTGATALTEKRKRLIRKALQDYPLEDVLDAVCGWRKSPHHRGENDRGIVYNDIGLLLRDAEHIEMFRDLERQPYRLTASPKTPIADAAAAYLASRRDQA